MAAVLEDIDLQLRVLELYHDQYFDDPKWRHNAVAGCLSSLLEYFVTMTLNNCDAAVSQGNEFKAFKMRVKRGLYLRKVEGFHCQMQRILGMCLQVG
ncbi:hypothetical protein QC762_0103450 [Podospora pseudocomata]|uniref:Uncharacterized protein n=1 Tax=Podospora pseudocomata TaxID=2093779 RepID=A0ABR0G245_9PEZI|nr:hypothetical protein QC762_0103450 [Podospora pseudocomata]